MTKKEMFETLMTMTEVSANEEIMTKLKHEIELLNRKNSTHSSKPTKTQIENEAIKEDIIEAMTDMEPMTVTELIDSSEKLSGYQNQKISALLRQLCLAGKAEKKTIKGKSMFSLIEE